jgi:hypothetical protein
MVKNQHGIQMQLMDHIMAFLKVEVNGLQHRMGGLRYDGVSAILVTDMVSLALH